MPEIKIINTPDLSGTYQILNDGYIQMPFIGTLE